MIRWVQEPDSDQVDVTFTISPEARDGATVAVVGDFNDWDPVANPLTAEAGDGVLTATVHVKAGRTYQFRYLNADGHWFNDEGADGYEDNGLGTKNCLLDLTAVTDPAATTPVSAPSRQ